MMQSWKKYKGIGLLELMLSLAIIAILLVTATRYYQITRTSQQVNEASQMVIAVYSAGAAWLQSNDQFSGDMIPKFVGNGSLPSEFSNPNANPWGGSVTAKSSNLSGTTLLVTLDNVPKDACENLKGRVQEKLTNVANSVQCSGDPATFTATLNPTR